MNTRSVSMKHFRLAVKLTQHFAEGVVSLLGLSFPSSSEGHFCCCRWVEVCEQRSRRQAEGNARCWEEDCCRLYTLQPPIPACDVTGEKLQLEMMIIILQQLKRKGNNPEVNESLLCSQVVNKALTVICG